MDDLLHVEKRLLSELMAHFPMETHEDVPFFMRRNGPKHLVDGRGTAQENQSWGQ